MKNTSNDCKQKTSINFAFSAINRSFLLINKIFNIKRKIKIHQILRKIATFYKLKLQ